MKAEIKIKKLSENAIVPTYGSNTAAGADLYACLDAPMTIEPNETKMISTAIAMEILPGFAGFIFARSGLASKRDLAPANKVGVIDSDYRGEIIVPLHNHGTEPQVIEHGERIAQIVFLPYLSAKFIERRHLSVTERGSRGFGSTGRK